MSSCRESEARTKVDSSVGSRREMRRGTMGVSSLVDAREQACVCVRGGSYLEGRCGIQA